MSLALYLSRVRSNEVLGRARLLSNGKHKGTDALFERHELGILHPGDGRDGFGLYSARPVQELPQRTKQRKGYLRLRQVAGGSPRFSCRSVLL
jgi:hypothetical protein